MKFDWFSTFHNFWVCMKLSSTQRGSVNSARFAGAEYYFGSRRAHLAPRSDGSLR